MAALAHSPPRRAPRRHRNYLECRRQSYCRGSERLFCVAGSRKLLRIHERQKRGTRDDSGVPSSHDELRTDERRRDGVWRRRERL